MSLTKATYSMIDGGIGNVKDFGAVGDGVTDDTPAFTAAQAAYDYIKVPSGFNCKVSAGLEYWKFFGEGQVFEPSRQWTLNPFPQTGDMSKTYVPRTFGISETAVASSITANSTDAQLITNTQILGTDAQGLAQVYNDRDHVAQYLSSSKFVPDVLDSSTTYTATSVTNAAISGFDIKPGMVIDTLHAIRCTAFVQSVSGTTITVEAWYPATPSGAGPVTPANGTGAIINPNTKIFGQNIVVSAGGNGGTTGASQLAGIELDVFTGASATPVAGTWGFDIVSIGGYMDIGYQIRGKRNISYFSRAEGGAGLIGFYSRGDQRGVVVEDSTNNAIVVTNLGNDVFAVGPNGGITSPQWNSKGIFTQGVDALQTVTTGAWFNVVTPFTENYGATYVIVGFNVATPTLRAKFMLLVNEDGITTISATDNTGLGIGFQLSGRQLQVRTTLGTSRFQFKSFSTVF